jgi:phosphinothricin acetyltransferase
MTLTARAAGPDDAADISRIYNAGIEDRVGTFETRPRTPDEVSTWFDGRHPIIVVEDDGGAIVAFASTFTYRARACYDGIAEFSVYVARERRGQGAGRTAMDAIIDAARDAGYWKLVSRVFVENVASRTLLASVGFREVGVYQRHAQLDGVWRDVVIVERLIPENQPGADPGATDGTNGRFPKRPFRRNGR